MRQRDAKTDTASSAGAETFRPADNSPFSRHLTHRFLLCLSCFYYNRTGSNFKRTEGYFAPFRFVSTSCST